MLLCVSNLVTQKTGFLGMGHGSLFLNFLPIKHINFTIDLALWTLLVHDENLFVCFIHT